MKLYINFALCIMLSNSFLYSSMVPHKDNNSPRPKAKQVKDKEYTDLCHELETQIIVKDQLQKMDSEKSINIVKRAQDKSTEKKQKLSAGKPSLPMPQLSNSITLPQNQPKEIKSVPKQLPKLSNNAPSKKPVNNVSVATTTNPVQTPRTPCEKPKITPKTLPTKNETISPVINPTTTIAVKIDATVLTDNFVDVTDQDAVTQSFNRLYEIHNIKKGNITALKNIFRTECGTINASNYMIMLKTGKRVLYNKTNDSIRIVDLKINNSSPERMAILAHNQKIHPTFDSCHPSFSQRSKIITTKILNNQYEKLQSIDNEYNECLEELYSNFNIKTNDINDLIYVLNGMYNANHHQIMGLLSTGVMFFYFHKTHEIGLLIIDLREIKIDQ